MSFLQHILTLFFKRNTTFLNPILPLTLGHWPWPWVMYIFLHIVTKNIGKMKCTTKIYLHSSQKETQLSMLHFFWNWVYSPAEKGQKVEVEYVQTFIAVS